MSERDPDSTKNGRRKSAVPPPPNRARAPEDPLMGETIDGRFRIIGAIARGGMGRVYRAVQAPLGRQVALKILHPEYSGEHDPEFHKRFLLEASTCARLTHPNTVTIFDYGCTDDEIYYIAMELLEGQTVQQELKKHGPLSCSRTMHVSRQICRSLREAHQLGIVHRDLKPANIFLIEHGDESDFTKVLDFGLVKDLADTGEDLTQTGLFMGSPKYMSPEQIRGDRVDPRSDIYALGVIMYEMLTGKAPFDHGNSVNTLMAHMHEEPQSLQEAYPQGQISPELEEIVRKCMMKEPAGRYPSMDVLLAVLKDTAASDGTGFGARTGLSISQEFGAIGTTGKFGHVSSTGAQEAIGPVVISGMHPPSQAAPARSYRIPAMILVGLLAVFFLSYFVASRHAAQDTGENHAEDNVATLPQEELSDDRVEGSEENGVEQAPVADPEPAPVLRTTLTLRSEPLGASVELDGEVLGQTPATLEWLGDDAERGRRVELIFRLEGYRPYTVTRVVTADTLEVDASLEPEAAPRRWRPRRPRPRPRPRPAGQRNAPARGYKLDPY